MEPLYRTMMTDCVMMDKKSVSDGLGAFKNEWSEGATFRAAIVKDSTMTAKIAEKQGVTEVYTITVDKGTPLSFHDCFKRKSDGATFRVTSNIKDSESPDAASFAIGQVSAERWNPA